MVSSERTGMEGKAKAERDSLTQAEEEDTSEQAYCADSCRQRVRLTRLSLALDRLVFGQENQGRRQIGRANIKKLCPTAIGAELAQTKTSLMH